MKIQEVFIEDFVSILKDFFPLSNFNYLIGGQEIKSFNFFAVENNLNITDISNDIEFEEIVSLDNALLLLYNLLFPKVLPCGQVLFYYPFKRTINGAEAVLLDSKYLYDFLIKAEYSEFYDEPLDATMFDFYFYFYSCNDFYCFEHPGIAYKFSLDR